MPERRRLLILGGTAEAAGLARRAPDALGPGVEVITSLAGRIKRHTELPGTVRVGGFGGSEGLAEYLRGESIDWVVDATHPFAEEISAHALAACLREEVPRLMLVRPPWTPPAGGRWVEVDDMEAAAQTVARLGRRVFLTIGRRGIEAFSGLDDYWFLVRLIEAPEEPLPLAQYRVLTGRPPHALEDERRILSRHRIDCLVAKNSGGATEAKIIAAHEAAIPTVLVRRPFQQPGEAVETVDEALRWLTARA